MNSETHAPVGAWEDLPETQQAPFLREAEEYVTQSIEHGQPSEITSEEREEAVLQTAREIYYETRPIAQPDLGRPGFTNAAIEEQARKVSQALNKRLYAYREPEGCLRMTAAPCHESGQLVAVYEKGRRLGRTAPNAPRIAASRQRISL
jgi:hypothetical protein